MNYIFNHIIMLNPEMLLVCVMLLRKQNNECKKTVMYLIIWSLLHVWFLKLSILQNGITLPILQNTVVHWMPGAVVSDSTREKYEKYETTIRSKEHGIEELKKLRKVNEKLLQFPISRIKKRVTCFSCYLQGDTETGLTPNRSESLLTLL